MCEHKNFWTHPHKFALQIVQFSRKLSKFNICLDNQLLIYLFKCLVYLIIFAQSKIMFRVITNMKEIVLICFIVQLLNTQNYCVTKINYNVYIRIIIVLPQLLFVPSCWSSIRGHCWLYWVIRYTGPYEWCKIGSVVLVLHLFIEFG